MAIDAGRVVAMLELDTSGFNNGLSSAQHLLRAWDSETMGLSDKLKATGAAMTTLGTAASTAITLPLAAAGGVAVKTFASFDDAMRQVRATMNASEGDTKKLTAAAREMGATTRYTASDAASALNYLALAGYNADQAIEALPTVLNLAQAGALELGFASDLVTDSMSALNIPMSELIGFSDQLAVTSQKSNTNVAQLGEAILTVGGTAKNMAGGTAELNAELGILADNGIKGAEGGTHLRNILIALQQPTADGAKALAAYTNGAYDAEGRLRSLDEIFQELKTSLEGATDAEKQNAIGALFNKTDLAAAEALLSGCGERFAELTGYIENSEGAAQQMADTMEGGIGGSFRNLSSAVEALGIAFGESLAPTVQKAADFLTGVTRAFSELPEWMRETIVEIGAVAAAVGPVLLVGGKLVTMFGTIAAAMTGPAGWITLGLAGFVALKAEMNELDRMTSWMGISADELEQYKLPDTIDLGTVTAEFTADIKNKGQSAYDLIVEIMNDGLPENEADYEKMAAGVNAVINGAMQAVADNYETKSAALKDLLDKGVISEEDYTARTAQLEQDTQATKDALTGDAQAVTDYVQALIAANAPMTEQQLAYLQQLIDKLVETSTAAGAAADAVMSGYKMAYERTIGGYGVEGDMEKAAQYVETSHKQKLNLAREQKAADEADFAQQLERAVPGSDEYSAILEASEKRSEEWAQIEEKLAAERDAMYGAMLESWGRDNFDILQFIKEYQPSGLVEGGYYSPHIDKNSEAGKRVTGQALMRELESYDISGLKDILGLWGANGEETIDLSDNEAMAFAIERLAGAYNELGASAQALSETDPAEITEKLEPVPAALEDVWSEMSDGADVHDDMVTAAENSADGYIQGWESKAPAIRSTIARIMSGVGGTTARVLAIKSPSRVMRGLGGYTAEGFALGIRDNETLVRAAAESMAGAAVPRTGTGSAPAGAGRAAGAVTLNLNNAVIRSDEDARTLARMLGGYVAAMNYGV